MILVDSSVWIDYFNGVANRETELLDLLLGYEEVLIGDLILAEVLQGFQKDRDFKRAQSLMTALTTIDLGGVSIAVKAAINFRRLRALGFTVRKTVDCIIATRCIESGFTLLHNDRDFDPFSSHLGMKVR